MYVVCVCSKDAYTEFYLELEDKTIKHFCSSECLEDYHMDNVELVCSHILCDQCKSRSLQPDTAEYYLTMTDESQRYFCGGRCSKVFIEHKMKCQQCKHTFCDELTLSLTLTSGVVCYFCSSRCSYDFHMDREGDVCSHILCEQCKKRSVDAATSEYTVGMSDQTRRYFCGFRCLKHYCNTHKEIKDNKFECRHCGKVSSSRFSVAHGGVSYFCSTACVGEFEVTSLPSLSPGVGVTTTPEEPLLTDPGPADQSQPVAVATPSHQATLSSHVNVVDVNSTEDTSDTNRQQTQDVTEKTMSKNNVIRARVESLSQTKTPEKHRSLVWEHFTMIKPTDYTPTTNRQEKQWAIACCKYCKANIHRKDGSTSKMFYHLHCVHDINPRKNEKSNTPVPAKKKQEPVVFKPMKNKRKVVTNTISANKNKGDAVETKKNDHKKGVECLIQPVCSEKTSKPSTRSHTKYNFRAPVSVRKMLTGVKVSLEICRNDNTGGFI